MQSDVNFPLVLCKPTSQIIQPKFNQCKRFVLHPHFPFIYLTISILGSSTIFGLSLKYTLRFVPSIKYVPKFGKNAGKGKFYARAQVNEKTSLKKFSKMIAMQTTVTYADVTAVLVSAVENLILELQRGNQVEFGDLGKFRLQIDFKSDTHIKGVNVQYAPGPELYSVFQNMEFVQVASRAVQRAALKAEKEGAKTIDIEEVKKAASKKQKTSGDSSAGGDSSTDGEHTSGGSTTGGSTTGGSTTGGSTDGEGSDGDNVSL